METTFVELDSRIYVILKDHEHRRLAAWWLDGNHWVKAEDFADAMFNGRVVSRAYIGTIPELPSFD